MKLTFPAGTEITIQYKGPLQGNVLRRLAFGNHWMFECRCPRCADPTEFGSFLSAMRCPEKCGGFILPIDSLDKMGDWKCSECGKTCEGDEIVGTVLKLDQVSSP